MLRAHRSKTASFPAVPTSDSPPIPEWAGHLWYTLRVGALQASATFTDDQVARFIEWFKGFSLTLPCPDCRRHYTEDLERYPFTAAHAKDPVLAMTWVEDLRARIENRKQAAGAGRAVGKPTVPPTPTPHPVPHGTSTPPVTAPVTAPVPAPNKPLFVRRSAFRNPPPTSQQLAVKSAIQQTVAHKHNPGKDCNCGKRRNPKAV